MTNWPAGDVLANGIRLHYTRTGGDKPPILLLHGITGNGLHWVRLARALEAEYDLVMLDARGHGLSEAPAASYGTRDHAADVAGLIEALGLQRPVIMGASMGANTAAAMAALFPALVRGIVLEDPPWISREEPDPERRAAGVEERKQELLALQARSLEEISARDRRECPTYDEAEFPPMAESIRQVSPRVWDWVLARPFPWRDIVRGLDCPGLLITADRARGAIVTPEVAGEVVTLWRRGRPVHIPGAGHDIRRAQFAPYLAAVRELLGSVYHQR